MCTLCGGTRPDKFSLLEKSTPEEHGTRQFCFQNSREFRHAEDLLGVLSLAGKLGRSYQETQSEIENFVPGRDMKFVHRSTSGTNS